MKVEVRKSNIHGLGVFATEDIKKGEDVTRYGGFLLCEQCCNRNIKDSSKYKRYVLGTEKGFLCGKTNENETDIGHYINDVFKPTIIQSEDPMDYLHTMIEYYTKAHEEANCFLAETCKARRDIKKGEELTVSYGYLYWVNVESEERTIKLPRKVMTVCLFFHRFASNCESIPGTPAELINTLLDVEAFESWMEVEFENNLKHKLDEFDMDELVKFVEPFKNKA